MVFGEAHEDVRNKMSCGWVGIQKSLAAYVEA
jgi:hypothetical protein